MRLYTKSGDKGETGLIGGARVRKDDPRVEAYGQIDELNASIGLAAVACLDDDWRQQLRGVQEKLFSLGAELANPAADRSAPAVTDADVTRLEGWIDSAAGALTPLTQFILPGGSELGGRFHVARTICRRAERGIVSLSGQGTAQAGALVYLNRLGDLLFAWGRLANAREGIADIVWTSPVRDQDDGASQR